ncbi:hypothetical protein FOCC_FOCC008447 [Frankliniella occidentalis]|uniref:Uncharacterized protein LOC113216129 n=1 Tax=Frankliniella occidentalis TaxID=133901 RepID=A0A6J1TLF3_FRAOC|nr:uncharacterized protein LOC113216129 [Frankliniella occidentalis]KAE8744882.1 hypothetical protein FOCC_FOCC008447 [Frankliniella occidentalis]
MLNAARYFSYPPTAVSARRRQRQRLRRRKHQLETEHISLLHLKTLDTAEVKMQTDKRLNGGVFRIDAATYYKYKAIVDRNNEIIRELKAQGEQKDKIIEKLKMDRLCFELVLASERGGKATEE